MNIFFRITAHRGVLLASMDALHITMENPHTFLRINEEGSVTIFISWVRKPRSEMCDS